MKQYVRKPVVVKAKQITDEDFQLPHPNDIPNVFYYPEPYWVIIKNKYGDLSEGHVGDWIIVEDSHASLCKKDDFHRIYEAETSQGFDRDYQDHIDDVYCVVNKSKGEEVEDVAKQQKCNDDMNRVLDKLEGKGVINNVEDDCATTDLFWDCECKYNYIHKKIANTQQECPICGAWKEYAPDSRINEVLEQIYSVSTVVDWRGETYTLVGHRDNNIILTGDIAVTLNDLIRNEE